MSKKKAEKKCVKCGKAGADQYVVGANETLKGPYCSACKPK
jgi:hypothetical protein